MFVVPLDPNDLAKFVGPPPRTSFTFTVLPRSYVAFAVKGIYAIMR